jgi:hypothetical protein
MNSRKHAADRHGLRCGVASLIKPNAPINRGRVPRPISKQAVVVLYTPPSAGAAADAGLAGTRRGGQGLGHGARVTRTPGFLILSPHTHQPSTATKYASSFKRGGEEQAEEPGEEVVNGQHSPVPTVVSLIISSSARLGVQRTSSYSRRPSARVQYQGHHQASSTCCFLMSYIDGFVDY